jgi:hypothetical protein
MMAVIQLSDNSTMTSSFTITSSSSYSTIDDSTYLVGYPFQAVESPKEPEEPPLRVERNFPRPRSVSWPWLPKRKVRIRGCQAERWRLW